jgi:hypothetical protein
VVEREHREVAMYAVMRSYTGAGAKELFDLLEERKSEVEALIRSEAGFRAYTLMRTANGGLSVTVCDDRSGTDESMERARTWIQENASDLKAAAPTVSEGEVILQLG